MNINAVSFGAKMPVSRIKVVDGVNDYVSLMLGKTHQSLEKVAELHNANVTIAQRNNLLMVNSGAITSYIDMAKMSKGTELYDGIVNNIRANSEANKGLDKARTFLA